MVWPDPTQWPTFPNVALYAVTAPRPTHPPVDAAFAVRKAAHALVTGHPVPLARVGLLVGSRGIAGLPTLVAAAVAGIRDAGAEPYLIPAMGSHGGGTHAGRTSLLAHLGVTEATAGAPFLGGEEAEVLGRSGELTLHWNRAARAVDAVLPLNRVKLHPSFTGTLQSGLVKMLVVGLGGPQGAASFHRAPDLGEALLCLANMLPLTRIAGGIALLEADGAIVKVEGVVAEALLEREAELLTEAAALMPALPTSNLQLLIVDRMGKDISGTGMDTHIIHRRGLPGEAWPGPIQRIYTRTLTGDGNANGVGLADAVHEELARAIDWQKTLLNIMTTTFVQRAKLPPAFATDLEALSYLWRTLGSPKGRMLRLAWIGSTGDLRTVLVTSACLPDIGAASDVRAAGTLRFRAGRMRLAKVRPDPG